MKLSFSGVAVLVVDNVVLRSTKSVKRTHILLVCSLAVYLDLKHVLT